MMEYDRHRINETQKRHSKMSLSGKVVTRVFQLCLRNNVIKYSQTSCAYLSRQPAHKHNIFHKPASFINGIISDNLSTKTVRSPARAMGALSPLDPSSYSRPELAIIKHISLSLDVDFEKKVLRGEATLNFDVLANIDEVPLDISNIKIESVETEGGTQLQYKVGDHVPNFGSKLTIILPKKASSGEKKDASISRSAVVVSVSCAGVSIRSASIEACEDPCAGGTALSYTGEMYKPAGPQDQCSDCTSTETVYIEVNCHQCLKRFKRRFDELSGSERESLRLKSTEGKTSLPPVKCTDCTADMTPNVATWDYPCCQCKQSDCLFQGTRLSIRIKYQTDSSASALQWLDAAQTSGKKHPYLFSQCQPIHARSILPCQDTPAVKFSYDAEVTAPEEFTVLMSALRGDVKNGKTSFRQPMPLPSYLVAIAVGALESRPLGPRSKVWSEKEEIERSAWEFADTEKYLQAAEKLCGRYEWTEYDLLVLPPSFPYGGMENPCLTFVTPTLLAGDRSQADVIVHEIMHSWTGNLVTNRNFEHFWLNEGFTVYLERKVAASLINDTTEAKKSRDFHSLLGLQELNEAIELFGTSNPLTNLVVNLDGVHPDDAFSRVPYEKGSLFLRYLEDLSGGPAVFDDFLRAYLTKFRKRSLDTNQFKEFLLEYFKDNAQIQNLDWSLWLHTSGMPPVIPDYDTSMTKAITELISKLSGHEVFSYDDVKAFTPHQMIHFLQQMIDRPPLSVEHLRTMGSEYHIVGNNNTEILYRWLRLCVKSKDNSKLGEVFSFLNSNGRMKYVRPLYRDLYAWEDVRQQAIDNFLANEKNMMHVSAYTLRKDLHLDG